MSTSTFVFVPGAWMGSWCWEETAERIRTAGYPAQTPTLPGLESGLDDEARAAVTLAEHVAAVVDLIDRAEARVILVGHSYSGTVVGQAADRRPDKVAASVHVGSFLPRDGRSLLDDWGDDEGARAEEKKQVRDDGFLWAAPPAEMLEMESDLSAEQRGWLSERFVAHPGRTVLDPATLSRPVTEQTCVYVADSADGLAPELADGLPRTWQLEVIGGGHWPMLTRPGDVDRLLLEAARRS